MDAQISVAGLAEDFESLLESGDFEGAEETLAAAISGQPQFEAFFQYQYGRLYSRWNKLTSATHHLLRAVELAQMKGDQLFVIQVMTELKSVKSRQISQAP